MEFAEIMTNIAIIITLIFGILGMVIQSSNFEGDIKFHAEKIAAINLASAVAAAPCITTKVLDESKVGVFETALLDEYEKKDFCIIFADKWYVEIETEEKSWKFGILKEFDKSRAYSLPVAVKNGNSVLPGRILVGVSS